MAQRIQRRRTKGWRMPEGAIYVGRPSAWGNPFRAERYERPIYLPNGHVDDSPVSKAKFLEAARRWAVQDFRAWLREEMAAGRIEISRLRGHDLACWCPLGKPCHADVLLELANA